MSATIALPDALTSASTAARTLFTEMLLEGDYGSGKAGFNITLTFTRGTNDTITITIPDDGSAGTGGNNALNLLRLSSNYGKECLHQLGMGCLPQNHVVRFV